MQATFEKTRANLLHRPWAIDDLDKILERLSSPRPYKKAVLFVDNAGSDIVLGKAFPPLLVPKPKTASPSILQPPCSAEKQLARNIVHGGPDVTDMHA